MFNFGNGELAVTYNRAPCAYEKSDDVHHDFHLYGAVGAGPGSLVGQRRNLARARRGACLAAGGAIDNLRARRCLRIQAREELDMSQPEACFFFGRSWAGKAVQLSARSGTVPLYVTFSLRSMDKGRTWERVPTLFVPPAHAETVLLNAHSPVRLPMGVSWWC